VGIAVGALALYLTSRDLAFDDLRAGLARLSPLLAAAALSTVVVTIVAVAVRWRFILRLAGIDATWRAVSVSVVLGQASNIVFPFRSGEAARAYVVASATGRSVIDVGATIVVERVFDVAMLAATSLALLAAGSLPIPLAMSRLATAAAVAVVAAAAALTLASRGAAGRAVRYPLARRLRSALAPAAASLRALHGWRRSSALTAMTVVTFLLAASTNYVLFRAFAADVPAAAALVVLIALQVGTTIASVPGNLGVFQYVTMAVLLAYGVARADAVAYAWSLYGLTVLPRVLAGALLMMSGHWSVPRDQGGSLSNR